MKDHTTGSIDDATINQLGLQLSSDAISNQLAQGARVFKYPGLEGVYIMESDLYGNPMPAGSCFLAFVGKHGLVGQHLPVEKLRTADAAEIKKIIEANANG